MLADGEKSLRQCRSRNFVWRGYSENLRTNFTQPKTFRFVSTESARNANVFIQNHNQRRNNLKTFSTK